MCWSVPAKIANISGNIAIVDILGVRKQIVLDLVSGPCVGEYVLVHAGYAIQKVNEEDANFTVDFFMGAPENA